MNFEIDDNIDNITLGKLHIIVDVQAIYKSLIAINDFKTCLKAYNVYNEKYKIRNEEDLYDLMLHIGKLVLSNDEIVWIEKYVVPTKEKLMEITYFPDCSIRGFYNMNLNFLDTSKITNMSNLYAGAEEFNGDISEWDVSNVEDMSWMFSGARKFNGDISRWNTKKVKDMSEMFRCAFMFNLDISNWNVSNVKSMSGMFLSAWNFNLDISKWNTKNVWNMTGMFDNAENFNLNISVWDVSNVTAHNKMFTNGCPLNGERSFRPKFIKK